MMISRTDQRNPFPAQPVATFGASGLVSAELESFRRAAAKLHEYLHDYATETTRHGGAVVLVGQHGSGKTHLLTYLSDLARAFERIEVGCVYAQPDDVSIFDVYKKVLQNLSLERIVHLLDLARLALAKEIVEHAQITESIGKRIEKTTDLQPLFKNSLIDAAALEDSLYTRLLMPDIPPEMVLALRNCSTSADAFQWL